MKVLGIEIGYSLTRICETDYKSQNPKIYKTVNMITPANVIDDGMLTVTDELIDNLKMTLKNNHIRTKNVVFSISSTKIAVREVLIPEIKENKIADLVETNAAEYFPMDINQYRLTHSVMKTVADENGTKKLKLMVLATPNQMLERYKELAVKCGLTVIAVDYIGNSLYQFIKNQGSENVDMILKADERMTYLMIVKSGAVLLQRTVSYGIDEAVETFSEGHNGLYTYTDVLDSFSRSECIETDSEAKAIGEDAVLKRNVTESLCFLVRGIGRVLDFYNSKNPNDTVKQIYLTGIGGEFKGFDKLLHGELGISTVALQSTKNSAAAKYFGNEDRRLGMYAACVGSAMMPLWSVSADSKQKKVKGEKNAGADLDKISIIVLGLGAIVAIVLTTYSIAMQMVLNNKKAELNARVEEMKPAEVIYNEYNYVSTLYGDAQIIQQSSSNNNDDLRAFIEEMEKRMPSDITVMSLTAMPESITVNMNVQSKEAAARAVAEFRKFESVSTVETVGLTDSINDKGYHDINFTVNCVYDTSLTEEGAEE